MCEQASTSPAMQLRCADNTYNLFWAEIPQKGQDPWKNWNILNILIFLEASHQYASNEPSTSIQLYLFVYVHPYFLPPPPPPPLLHSGLTVHLVSHFSYNPCSSRCLTQLLEMTDPPNK